MARRFYGGDNYGEDNYQMRRDAIGSTIFNQDLYEHAKDMLRYGEADHLFKRDGVTPKKNIESLVRRHFNRGPNSNAGGRGK